jgi:threonyl-tRNA synthetase
MAAAVLEMFPEAKLGIGPAVDNGFYYDFDLPRTLIPEDLVLIDKKMRQIIAQDLLLEGTEADIAAVWEKENQAKQDYKVELLDDLKREGIEKVSLYKLGDFVDLCKGPHVSSTGDLKKAAFRLDKIAGAYWRGSEKNKMLQRIYAIAFSTKEDLSRFLKQREEAEKRDHRKLGAELDLFSFHEEAPGFPFWHPRGMILWNILLNWWREEHLEAGYEEIKTPMIMEKSLWQQSGHWDHYKNSMYFTKIDERDFAVKPMNCPGGMLLYKEKIHSYREFPLRVAEIGQVHRHELAGTLHGLMRVRAFHQDDAHIFCAEEQIDDEVIGVINLVDKMYRQLGLEYHLELSTRPKEGSIGSDEMWQKAEAALESALSKKALKYKLNPGDGAFYGPKIDFHIKDAIGRTWQTATIQLDFAMPERFELEYVAPDGSMKRPVMLHRVVFGAIERFIGIITEHFAGAFSLWLAPEQARIITVSEKFNDYAEKVKKELQNAKVRVEIDASNDTLGKKIRAGEISKIPYLLIVGEKEVEAQTIAVRRRGEGDKGTKKIAEFLEEIKNELKN